MVKVEFTKPFLRDAKRLPDSIKMALRDQIRILAENPSDSRLHGKKLKGKFLGYLSFRVTRNYRVIFRHHDETKTIILLLSMDDRKDAYH